MKTTVLRQRDERDKLLDYPYVERVMQRDAVSILTAKPIKLITGPRRAGKSTLALQMLKGLNFAYLNFDDGKLLDQFEEDDVEVALTEVYGHYDYLLLDEIQNLDGWALWVEKLYRRGVNMVITGSNAKLLSDDLASALTGRFIEIRLYPFAWDEYLSFRGLSSDMEISSHVAVLKCALDEFSLYGGYPEVMCSKLLVPGYLSALYDSILLKDIVKRYNVRKVVELSRVADWLLSNFANTFSMTSLAVDLDMGSTATVQKFCLYLQNTYLFQYLPRFDRKLKLMNKADRKVYVIDNGFVTARAFELTRNMGRLFENMVFMELLKRGYDVRKYQLFYYRSRNDREVDFVLKKGVEVDGLVQVCYDLSARKTREREIRSLIECSEELKSNNLTIITWDCEEEIEVKGKTVRVLPFYKWAAEKSF